ncbi:MAG: GrpB family protein [Candidatus Geothermarchaeales archaeon]
MSLPIIISDYDPQWPILFQEEKARILDAIGDRIVAVEHIGSTAVPGLGAEPIIDIIVGVRSVVDAEKCINPLERIDYEYVPDYEEELPERRYFRKGPPEEHRHLHMVEVTNDFWERHLLFRDFLRAHREVAQEYYQLKKRLAVKHGSDHEGYTHAKTKFIKFVVDEARVASEEQGKQR